MPGLSLILMLACGPSDGPGTDSSGSHTDTASDTATDTAAISAVTASVDETIGTVITVNWTQATAGSPRVQWRTGLDWQDGPQLHRDAGSHSQILLGAAYDSQVELRVTLDPDSDPPTQTDAVVSVETATRPQRLPATTVLVADPDQWDPDFEHLLVSVNASASTYGGPWFTIIINREGQVVWALQTPDAASTLFAGRPLEGPHLRIDHNSFWTLFDGAAASQVATIAMDGTAVASQATPGMGHAWIELPDGRLAWMDGASEQLWAADAHGDVDVLWSCPDWLASIGATATCGTNTITHDATSNSLLLSFFSSETVVQLGLEPVEVLRWFGHIDGAYGFDPEDATFWWQHGAVLTDSGSLLLSTKHALTNDETVVREYIIDDDSQTLVQSWSFGQGEGIFAETLGEAWRLPSGNTLHNLGSAARVREISPAGQVVWDLSLGGEGQWIGRSTVLPDLYTLLEDQGASSQ